MWILATWPSPATTSCRSWRYLVAHGRGHIAAVHFKDTRRGQLRYVPLGEGEVPFAAACAALARAGFQGPAVVELWTETYPEALTIVAQANQWLRAQIAEGWRLGGAQPL